MAKNFKLGSETSPVDLQISDGGIKDKNSSLGTDGQVLKSDGSKIYWDNESGGGSAYDDTNVVFHDTPSTEVEGALLNADTLGNIVTVDNALHRVYYDLRSNQSVDLILPDRVVRGIFLVMHNNATNVGNGLYYYLKNGDGATPKIFPIVEATAISFTYSVNTIRIINSTTAALTLFAIPLDGSRYDVEFKAV